LQNASKDNDFKPKQNTMTNNLGDTYATVPTQFIEANGAQFAYRSYGKNNGIPVVYLNHLAAVLDNCDPRVMDGIAAQRQIVSLDYRGAGASSGVAPETIQAMARDTIAFIKKLGFEKVDLLGFSLGGMVSQEIVLQESHLVNKMILAGTGPRGGKGIDKVTKITYYDILRGYLTFRDPKYYLFFTQTTNGKSAARQFLKRIKERTLNRDKTISISTMNKQLKAIHTWSLEEPADLSQITQKVFVVNGDDDRMVPTTNSYDMAKRFPNSELIIYPDSGHGGIFQNHEDFVKQALSFLSK
jgi:pimeloyl-ACP methyl ester carboxylesterase